MMNSLLTLVVSFLLLASNAKAHDYYQNDEKGIWITPNIATQKQLLKVGDEFTFDGDICVVKMKDEGRRKKCLKVPSSKFSFKAYFPDSLHDVTDKLVITQANDKKSWKYSLKTDKIKVTDLNQFTLSIGTGDKKTSDLFNVKAKLEKRILLLNGFKTEYAGKVEYKENLAYINQLITYLQSIVTKINTALESSPEILAQLRHPLQVENKASAPFFYSTNVDGYKISLQIPVGVPFEGEKAELTASVTNLRAKEFYFPEVEEDNPTPKVSKSADDKHMHSLSIGLDGSTLLTSSLFSLGFAETKTITVKTGKLNPNLMNKISVDFNETSNEKESKEVETESIATLFYDLPVIMDNVAPVFSNLSPLADSYINTNPLFKAILTDSLGRIDPQTLNVNLSGTTVDATAVNKDVTSIFSIATQDLGPTYNFVGTILDLVEGNYAVTYNGADFAGNPATAVLKTIHYDKTLPKIALFNLDNILTNNPSYKMSISVADVSPINSRILQNGNEVFQTADYSFDYSATLVEGINTFEVQAVDAASNVAISQHLYNITLDTIPPVLSGITPVNGDNIYNPDFNLTGTSNEPLLSLTVNGKSYATGSDKKSFSIPLKALVEGDFPVDIVATDLAQNSTSIHLNYHIILKVLNSDLIAITPNPDNADKLIITGSPGATRPNAEVNFYGGFFNRQTLTANADGSFQAMLDFFNSVDIKATDLNLNRSDSATLKYNVDTTLAGIVRDTNDLPLAGATVTILGSGQQTVTDQTGSFRIPKPATGDQVLSVDGTTIPLGVTGGTRKFFKVNIAVSIGTRQLNVMERPIHLAPLLFDGSETAISDANTGATVTSPHAPGVALEIPAGVTTFPDSKTSRIMNVAEISSDYTTIAPFDFARPTTVYAFEPSGVSFSTPVKLTLPNVNQIPPGVQMVIMSKNSQKGIWEIDGLARVSADGSSVVTEDGGGITHFSEVYAAPIGPRVSEYGGTGHVGADVFNGSLQNSIDLPSYKVNGSDFVPNLSYHSNWANPYVVVSNIIDVPRNEYSFQYVNGVRTIFQKIMVTTSGKGWVEPDFIKANFYTNKFNSQEVTFSGVPQKSVISYALDLSSESTGLKTYNSHYNIHLKQMILGTRKLTASTIFSHTITRQESFSESRALEEVFPQDLGGTLYLQNYYASRAGQGWRINGVGRLYNLDSPKIMVEESNGATSSYGLNTNIETEYFDSSSNLTAADLKAWPTINIFNSANNGLFQFNAITNQATSLGNLNSYTGKIRLKYKYISAMGYNICRYDPFNYTVNSTASSLSSLFGKVLLSTSKGTILDYSNGSPKLLSGKLNVPPAIFPNQLSGLPLTNLGYRDYLSYCSSLINGSCSYAPPAEWQHDWAIASSLSQCDDYYFQLPDWQHVGVLPYQGYLDGQDPMYNNITDSIEGIGDEIIVADSGNHRVRAVNIVTNSARTIAGDGHSYDAGDGQLGINASLYHPTGLAQDAAGNIYISTENGFIRKLDPNGYISTFAGAANGILADVTQAQQMRLNRPSGMVVDNQNNYLYVSDTGHNRVLRIDLSTRVATTVAGSGACQSGNIGDGSSAITASLCSPGSLGLDDKNNLLIFDQGHNRIRRVLLNNSTNGVLSFEPIAKDNSTLTRQIDGTFLRKFRNGSIAKYDQTGKQILSQDRIGNKISFQYNSDGSLASITDPTSRSTTYQYSLGKLSSITDPQGRVTDFYYTGNILTDVRFPDGSGKSFEYDANGLMTAEIDKRGSRTTYVYNQWHRLQSVTLADGSTSVIQDGTSATIGNNFVSGNIGSLKSITKNEVVDGIKDSKGQTTILNKDENGFVTTITDAKGNVYSVDRDIDGRPTKIARPDGSYSLFTYDPIYHDFITKFDSATNVTINYQFDTFGNLISQNLPSGGVVTYNYDPTSGLLTSKTLPLNTTEAYEYYSNGLLMAKTNPLGQRISFVYGGNGNLATITDNLNQSTQIIRDLAGNVVANINSKGQRSDYTYDNFNRLTSVKSPKGEITSYEYLPSGELSKIIDPQNNTTLYEYDLLGRVAKKTDPLGLKTQLSYDANGNLAQEIDPSGNVKTYQYDSLDRLIKKTLPDNVYNYTYDPRNNLDSVSNFTSAINYAYIHTNGGDLVDRETTNDGFIDYNYDASGNRSEMLTSQGNFFYTHDSLNRLRSVTNHKGEVFDFSYDQGSRLIKQRTPASISNYAYDGVNFLTQINHQNRSTLATLTQFDYTRDSIGNITRMTSVRGAFNYVYDNNNQLISATHPEDVASSFTYDSLGNRITDQLGNYNYDNKRQRLTDDWKYTYAYDNNGNLSSKILKADNTKVTNYIHNSENQLINIKEYNGTSVINETKYYYDAVGRRIRKEHFDYNNSANAFTRKYQYDNQEILFELDGSNNLLSTFTHSGLRTDDVLSVDKAGISYFYLKDHLGTVNDIIDGFGNLVQHYVYSSFGKIARIENAAGVDITSTPMVENFYTFTGREFDKESGLYYYRARYLDSETGRFIQSDPHPGSAGAPITLNSKYIYANNNSMNNIDPSGTSSFATLFSITVGVGAAYGSGVLVGMAIGSAIGGPPGAAIGAVVGAYVGAYVGASVARWMAKRTGGNPETAARWGAFLGGIAGGIGGSSYGYGNPVVDISTAPKVSGLSNMWIAATCFAIGYAVKKFVFDPYMNDKLKSDPPDGNNNSDKSSSSSQEGGEGATSSNSNGGQCENAA